MRWGLWRGERRGEEECEGRRVRERREKGRWGGGGDRGGDRDREGVER